jgi:NAD(P) transhydrogenase subunit alpha
MPKNRISILTLTLLAALITLGAFAGKGELPPPLLLAMASSSLDPAASTGASSVGELVRSERAEAPVLDYWSMLFVFMLATFIGIGVIRRVSRLLHTPLMSLTNAISAIAVVGSIIVTGSEHPLPIRILGAIALFASMTNIVSGFLITDRMLKMFKGGGGRK